MALDDHGVIHGGSEMARTATDTLVLIGPWGSGALVNGQFQGPNGDPAWNGWTHRDMTEQTESHWSVSDFHPLAGSLSAYCGDATLPACSETDEEGGYGNSWEDILRFDYTVTDPQVGCTMVVSGVASCDTEPGYDFVHFQFQTQQGTMVAASWDGIHSHEAFSYSYDFTPTDYLGPDHNTVRFEFLFTSDNIYSDEDCLFSGSGAVRVDDLTATATNGGLHSFTDFEDGTLGPWEIAYPVGVGDFSQLWVGLADLDPCLTNFSPQVAFIDDGQIVPGVGPTECMDWCYGPGGYLVNSSGGRLGYVDPYGAGGIQNYVESPVLELPPLDGVGVVFGFDVFVHENLGADSPGIFYTWEFRSAQSPEEMDQAQWRSRNFVYYGGPEYRRPEFDVSDLLEDEARYIQVRLGCRQYTSWSWWGHNGTPAPYFDNARVLTYEIPGPALTTREIDLAQDGFPATGVIDMQNLASNAVRFDNAQNKATGGEEHNIPGDSITCDVASLRAGAEIVENRLYYSMHRNPVFDSVRDPAWGATGFVDARPAVNSAGNVVPGKFAYDLPDSGFLFPGDILHYHFSATDAVGGGDARTSTLPADLTGYGDFSGPDSVDPLGYNSSFTFRALPTVDADGTQPSILFWNDFANRGGEDEWLGALRRLGQRLGIHYDLYYTNGPSSGVGNGLGGRCTPELMAGYSELFYTCGDLVSYTLAHEDIELLNTILTQAAVDVFLTGDNLAADLHNGGLLGEAFLSEVMNIQFHGNDIRATIDNQTAPLVRRVPGNSVFYTTPPWRAYGSCPGINIFDGVTAGEGAQQLARFTDPAGNAAYDWSAATMNITDNGSRIISMPYDFMSIYTDPNHPPSNGWSTRTNLLEEILALFQVSGGPWPTPVPEAGHFSASNHPNPFNPVTRIDFNLPRDGRIEIRVFDVRGHQVATLLDEQRAAGSGHVMWDGRNDAGAYVGSGVYFYEARAAGEVKVGKMTLLK